MKLEKKRMETNFPKLLETISYRIIIYSDNSAEIKRYLGNDPKVVIPSEIEGYSIQNISQMAFADCAFLKKAEISEGITYIGVSAFQNCKSLAHVSLPESLETIFVGAFSGCSNLRVLEIPDNVSYIDTSAFRYLTDIEIHVTAGTEADKQMNKKYMGFIRKKEAGRNAGENKAVWVPDSELYKEDEL